MCEATYPTTNGKKYVQYYSIIDKSDPLQVTALCSLGTQIVNGQGVGVLYAKVTQNGEEIDPMYTENFVVNGAPSTTAVAGEYYYKLNSSTKTVTLMKYNGSSWVQSSDTYDLEYTWSYRDKDGKAISDREGYTSGKVVYIDGSLVKDKIVCDVKVSTK